MKSFKSFVLIFALTAMIPMQIFAQKPAKTTCFDEECVSEILEKMMSPNDSVAIAAYNTIIEMTDEAGMSHDSRMVSALKASMISFIVEGKNPDENIFLIMLFPKFCWADDCRDLMKLTENELITHDVLMAVGDINGSGSYIENYIMQNHDNLKFKSALAYGVGRQHISSMEDELITWLKDAYDPTKVEIYNALLVIRSNEKTTAIVEKGAKKLNKSKYVNSKIAGMRLLTALNGENAMPMLYKALKNKDARVRREALELMKPYANDEVAQNVVKKCKKGDAVVDAVDWLGDIKNDSQMEFVMKQFSSTNPKAVEAAIRAVFKIDYAAGIDVVKPMFGGQYQEVIKEAVISYKGDYNAVLSDVMRHGNANQQYSALQILECRPTVALSARVKELVSSSDPKVRDEAYKLLKLVMPMTETQYLMTLLEYCDDKYVEDVQIAIKEATINMSADKKDEFASTLKHVKADVMPRYYNVFAYFGTELCVDKLIDAYQNGAYKFEAKEALLLVENAQFQEKINKVLQ